MIKRTKIVIYLKDVVDIDSVFWPVVFRVVVNRGDELQYVAISKPPMEEMEDVLFEHDNKNRTITMDDFRVNQEKEYDEDYLRLMFKIGYLSNIVFYTINGMNPDGLDYVEKIELYQKGTLRKMTIYSVNDKDNNKKKAARLNFEKIFMLPYFWMLKMKNKRLTRIVERQIKELERTKENTDDENAKAEIEKKIKEAKAVLGKE